MRKYFLFLALGLFLLVPRAKAQIDVIQFQNNGTTFHTVAAPFSFNCAGSLTCSQSGSTITANASSTAATNWDAITAGTNTAALLVGTGGSLETSGTGIIKSNAIPRVTVSLLVAIPDGIAWVTDGVNANDCTVGGGTYAVLCSYNGTAWTSLAASGTVTDGSGTTTADSLAVSTGTAHTLQYVAPPSTYGTQPIAPIWNGSTLTFEPNTQTYSSPATTYTVAGTDRGSVLQWTAAPTITLPQIAATGIGQGFFFHIEDDVAAGGTAGTLTANATDTINGGTAGGNISVYPQSLLLATATGATAWTVTSVPLATSNGLSYSQIANGLSSLAGCGTATNLYSPASNDCTAPASGAGGGTVTYTTSTTASTADNGKLVMMDCSANCTYTLPATQPSTTFSDEVMATGAGSVTVAVTSPDTWNGGTSNPYSLIKFNPLRVVANSSTSTDYDGGGLAVANPGSSMLVSGSAIGTTLNATVGASEVSIASRNTAITATSMDTYNGAQAPDIVLFSAWDSAAGVGCTGNTTVTWSFSYIDQTGTTQTAPAITETITANGGATGGDAVNQSFIIPANLNNATGLQYSATYSAGTGCTTDPSFAAAIKVVG